jgi:hypothetical protein
VGNLFPWIVLRQIAGATKPPAQQVGITPAIENRVDVHAALVQQVLEGKRTTPDQHAMNMEERIGQHPEQVRVQSESRRVTAG